MAFNYDMEERLIEIFKGKTAQNILHIGACLAEEKHFYHRLNPEKIYWFEPNPQLLDKLKDLVKSENCESTLFPYAVGKENGVLPFNIIWDTDYSNPGCSSLKNLKEHSRLYPKITLKETVDVQVVNLDSFIIENGLVQNFDLVSLDTQGNDYDILSTSEFIFTAKAIVIETADIELYEGQILEKNLTEYMESKGFIKSYYSQMATNWGDTLYIKK